MPYSSSCRTIVLSLLLGGAVLGPVKVTTADEVSAEAKLAVLKLAGEPLSIKDLAPKPISPDGNAATFLAQAAADLQAVEQTVGTAIDALGFEDQSEFAFQARTTEQVQRVLREAFAEHRQTISLLVKAAHCRGYAPQLNYDQPVDIFTPQYLDTMQDVRRPIRVLNYHVTMLLNDGQGEEALESCLTMFRLCRHFDSRPLVIGFLVNQAVRGVAIHASAVALQSGLLPEGAREAFEAELARHDVEGAFRHALSNERAWGIDLFKQRMQGNALPLLDVAVTPDDLRDYLEVIEQLDKLASQPYDKIHAWPAARPLAFAQDALPGLRAAAEIKTETVALLRCLRVLNELTHTFPGGVKQNPTGQLELPEDSFVDPYNDHALRFRYTAGGWLIYSVGSNGQDDGGKIDSRIDGARLDVGLGPRETK